MYSTVVRHNVLALLEMKDDRFVMLSFRIMGVIPPHFVCSFENFLTC